MNFCCWLHWNDQKLLTRSAPLSPSLSLPYIVTFIVLATIFLAIIKLTMGTSAKTLFKKKPQINFCQSNQMSTTWQATTEAEATATPATPRATAQQLPFKMMLLQLSLSLTPSHTPSHSNCVLLLNDYLTPCLIDVRWALVRCAYVFCLAQPSGCVCVWVCAC